jgi:hypothetical protein
MQVAKTGLEWDNADSPWCCSQHHNAGLRTPRAQTGGDVSLMDKSLTVGHSKTRAGGNLLKTLAGTTGLEPATSCVTGSLG